MWRIKLCPLKDLSAFKTPVARPELHVPSMKAGNLRCVRAGMQAFAAAAADEGLLGLCDTILEALHFCPGFQTCLTCGELSLSFDTQRRQVHLILPPNPDVQCR